MKRCWHKGVAESSSIEAQAIKRERPNINYNYCKRHCRGDNPTCAFYVLREMNPIEEETAEDSALVLISGMDDIDCQITDDEHRIYHGGYGN